MMRRRCSESIRNQRGAVLIYVAISLLGLLGFAALVVDYGVMWASRRQAQNAADAGALAGAVSLAYVDPDDQPRARNAAAAAGAANLVWGLAPNIDPAADVIIGPCPPGSPGLPDTCVRVNVYRNQYKDPLPTFFARLFGIANQGVRATATAQVLIGNSSECLKPWAVPDKWFDYNDTPQDNVWTWDDQFERYYENGPNAGQLLPNPVDVYEPPSSSGPGSGFRLPEDHGVHVRLKAGNPQQTLTAGWFFPIDLPRIGEPMTGGDRYRENIYSCNSVPVLIGDLIWNEPGNMIGPTSQGVRDLIAQDPDAHWVDPDGELGPQTGTIVDSCAQDTPPCAMKSPRLVAIPIFDVDAWSNQDKTSGRFQIRITNIIGFFIEEMQGNDVMGVFVNYPGLLRPGGGTLTPPSAFLRTVALVR
jgi:hypothetical protein